MRGRIASKALLLFFKKLAKTLDRNTKRVYNIIIKKLRKPIGSFIQGQRKCSPKKIKNYSLLRYTCGNTYTKPKRTKIKPFSYFNLSLFLYKTINTQIKSQVVVVNKIDSKDTYFYDTTLAGLEAETQWSENDFEGSSKASEGVNKEAKQNGPDEKEMAIQALDLLQTIIKEYEISDTDILINTIRDYIKK